MESRVIIYLLRPLAGKNAPPLIPRNHSGQARWATAVSTFCGRGQGTRALALAVFSVPSVLEAFSSIKRKIFNTEGTEDTEKRLHKFRISNFRFEITNHNSRVTNIHGPHDTYIPATDRRRHRALVEIPPRGSGISRPLFRSVRSYTQAATYQASDNPVEAILLSIALDQEKRWTCWSAPHSRRNQVRTLRAVAIALVLARSIWNFPAKVCGSLLLNPDFSQAKNGYLQSRAWIFIKILVRGRP